MKKRGRTLRILMAALAALAFWPAPGAGAGEEALRVAHAGPHLILHPGARAGFGALSAWAQGSKIALDVKVIRASNDGSGIDPALGDLRSRLSNLKFNSYELVSSKSLNVEPPKGGKVSLPGGKVLQFGDVARADDRVQMDVSVANVVRTRVSLANHGTVMLGGIDDANGELILAISASF